MYSCDMATNIYIGIVGNSQKQGSPEKSEESWEEINHAVWV